MIKVTKETEYALICLVELGRRKRMMPARELSEAFHIPGELLSKILQKLARKNILRSVQGPRGGYLLERPLQGITMGELIEILDPVEMAPCVKKNNCVQGRTCNIRRSMTRIQGVLDNFFSSLTLEDFVQGKIA